MRELNLPMPGFFNSFDLISSREHLLQNLETNVEWNRCTDSNGASLARCILHCERSKRCEDDCISEFENEQTKCPCEVPVNL